MTRSLILGRFQPPHRGHLDVIEKTAKRADEVVVVIGSAQASYTLTDPFTAGERFEMLRAAFAERGLANVVLVPVADINRHNEWVAYVEGLVPEFDEVVTSNPVTELLFKRAGYRVRREKLIERPQLEGKRIRARLAKGEKVADAVGPAVQKVLNRLRAAPRLARVVEDSEHGRPTHP